MKSAVMRYPEVRDLTGFSRTTIWRFEKTGHFPKRIRLGPNSVGWRSEEIERWLENCPQVAQVALSAHGHAEQGAA